MPLTEINGKKIFYSWKPASRAGLTLFFIHGLGGAHSFWSPVIPDLVEAGFSCLAIDVPGAWLKLSVPTDAHVDRFPLTLRQALVNRRIMGNHTT